MSEVHLHGRNFHPFRCCLLDMVGIPRMVGKTLVAKLAQLEHFTRIVTLGRRVVAYDGPGKEKLDQHVVDFDKIDEHKALLENPDVGFNTMGTTAVDTGSSEQFTKIDHDIPLHVIRLFKEANPSKPLHMLDLSSGGASATSPMLYPKTKGLLEQHISELGFAKMSILRPGLLVYEGEKREKSRMAKTIMITVHQEARALRNSLYVESRGGDPFKVIGVPATIDGDMKNQFVETNVGFDTTCKVYSQLISNICTHALFAEKVILLGTRLHHCDHSV